MSLSDARNHLGRVSDAFAEIVRLRGAQRAVRLRADWVRVARISWGGSRTRLGRANNGFTV